MEFKLFVSTGVGHCTGVWDMVSWNKSFNIALLCALSFAGDFPMYLCWVRNLVNQPITGTHDSHIAQGKYAIYQPTTSSSGMHRHFRFSYAYFNTIPLESPLTASVTSWPDRTISLHSTLSLQTTPPEQHVSFLYRLKKEWHSRLCNSFVIDDDGVRIPSAAQRNSLIIVHNGSYMPGLDPSISSAALVILCSQTGKMGSFTVCERTHSATASNYRAEVIGGLLASHILCMLDSMIPQALQV